MNKNKLSISVHKSINNHSFSNYYKELRLLNKTVISLKTREACFLDDECINSDPYLANVNEFTPSKFSLKEIEAAGKIIGVEKIKAVKGEVPFEVERAFLVANNWRDSHAYPMRSIRATLGTYLRLNGIKGITAARLKRMHAIRGKLKRFKHIPLHKMQDLGGCRVILPSIAAVHQLNKIIRERIKSQIIKENDYILSPKTDGYRSHHLVFSFFKPKSPEYQGKRIELQVRTRLQHSWATAIEAVGLYRGEALKNNVGDKNWLRFFMLMSAEFADAEKCPSVPNSGNSATRKEEIKKLESSLNALNFLESISNGVRGTDLPIIEGYKPTHYLIRYDFSKKIVTVEPHNKVNTATASYEEAERGLRDDDERDVAVLVEVDKIKNLKKAYPNYFFDVELFKDQLKNIVQGGTAVEFFPPPKQRVAKKSPETVVDPSWLVRPRFKKPNLKKIDKERTKSKIKKTKPKNKNKPVSA